jgi:DNA-binding CsgD family transcriptional regulator
MMASLTPRQRQVYTLKAEGKTEREIARMLGIAYSTVKSYSRDARRKTGRTSIELACAAAVAKVQASGG